MRGPEAAAMTPIANAAEVMALQPGAVDAQKRGVHLRVAVWGAVEKRAQFAVFGWSQDQLAHRRRAAVGLVVHLKRRVGFVSRRSRLVNGRQRRSWPRTNVALPVGRFDIKLDERVCGHGGQDKPINAIPR